MKKHKLLMTKRQKTVVSILTVLALFLLIGLTIFATKKTENEKKILWFDSFLWPVTGYNIKAEENTDLLIPVSTGGRYGFINRNGEVVIPLDFADARPFSENLAPVAVVDDSGAKKWGYIDTAGKLAIPAEYDEVWPFSEGLAVVKVANGSSAGYGFINASGELVIPANFAYAASFSDGLALVSVTNADNSRKYGFINTLGEAVVPTEYDSAASFSEGVATVGKKQNDGVMKYGVINSSGEIIIHLHYDSINECSNGLILVSQQNINGITQYGYFNSEGRLAIPLHYSFATPFTDGLAKVYKRTTTDYWTGFIDTTGKCIFKINLNAEAGYFSEGLAWYMAPPEKDGTHKYGFIDSTGEIVIPAVYDSTCWPVQNGMAIVYSKKKSGIVNPLGEEILPLKYDDIVFVENIVFLRKGTKTGMFLYE